MNLRTALLSRLENDATVAAIFGSRIHWIERPQAEALPALVLQVISGVRDEDLDGVEAMRTARLQVDSLALEKAKGGGGLEQAVMGIEAAIAALLPEDEVSDPASSVVFWRAAAEEPRDLGEQTDTGFIYRQNADVQIRYLEV